MSTSRYGNGHRRRQLRQRHLATAARHTCPYEHCPWPNEPFDPTLDANDPKAPEVDEIIPASLGGSVTSWANTRLMHRQCNQRRGNGTRSPRQPVDVSTPPQTSRAW